jgi:hypothetical protein
MSSNYFKVIFPSGQRTGPEDVFPFDDEDPGSLHGACDAAATHAGKPRTGRGPCAPGGRVVVYRWSGLSRTRTYPEIGSTDGLNPVVQSLLPN